MDDCGEAFSIFPQIIGIFRAFAEIDGAKFESSRGIQVFCPVTTKLVLCDYPTNSGVHNPAGG
jgi:hypothetical protein